MNITRLEIPEILLLKPHVYSDGRGFFFESFHSEKFHDVDLPDRFVQDNHSGSKGGTIRGLHYQIRHAQGKLVSVVVGEIFDVAVDLRKSSPTFGQWVGLSISADEHQQLWIPIGFAHGFYVMSDWAEVTYKVTDSYAPEWERTLLWNDPEIGIDWPLKVDRTPILSEKDAAGLPLQGADLFD